MWKEFNFFPVKFQRPEFFFLGKRVVRFVRNHSSDFFLKPLDFNLMSNSVNI